MPGAPKARVFGVTRFGQCAGRCLADQAPDPLAGDRVRRQELLVLEEEGRTLVTRQQSEQNPVGELERACLQRVGQLEQPAILRDGPHILDALRGGGGGGEKVSAPDSVVLLLPRHGKRRLGLRDRCPSRLNGLGRLVSLRRQFPEGAIADRLAAVLEQPG